MVFIACISSSACQQIIYNFSTSSSWREKEGKNKLKQGILIILQLPCKYLNKLTNLEKEIIMIT